MNQLTTKEKALLHLTSQALFPKENELNIDTLKKKDLTAELKEANVQAVFSLVYSVLKKQGINPPNFEKTFLQTMANNIRVGHDHSELHEMLSSNDIPYVAMKGSASAMYYPEPFLRTMGDVDFLVNKSDLEKAGVLLEQAGFVPVEKNDHECHIAYHRRRSGIRSIWEMHWSPSGIPKGEVGELTREYLADIIETAVPCTTQGSECLIPTSFHHGLIMLLHTAIHLINTGIGLRHLCDWAVFANKFSDEEFKEIFEEKLKAVGMWRFAQILTRLSITYLGMPEKHWCDVEMEPEYLETLMSDIFKGGNFGVKDSNRINQAKLITSSHKASVDETSLFMQLVRTMNEKAKIALPITKSVLVLLPVGWIYAGGRHLLRIRSGRRPKIDVSDMVRGATERRELYKEFRLFLPEGNAESLKDMNSTDVDILASNTRQTRELADIDLQTMNFLQIMSHVIHLGKCDALPVLSEPVDWEYLENISKTHNLFALFHEGACQYSEYRNRLNYEENINTVMTMVGQQIKKTESFLELYRAFLKENLHPIVMKGIICRQLYCKNSEKRPSGDEDILVQVDEFHKIKEILEKKGYVCEFENITEAQLEHIQHISFYDNKNGFLIEVHTNPMGHRNDMRTQMNNFFGEAFELVRLETVKGVPLYTFSHDEHFLFLILHSLKHFAEGGVGVRQMLDILLYQEQYENEIDWEILESRLKETHADKYLGDMQHIGMKYLGFEFKVCFEKADPVTLLNDMMESGVFGKKERADIVAANITLEALNHKEKGIYAWFRAGFPSRKLMLDYAPHLAEKPWLVPVEWIKRWGRFLKKARKYNGNLMLDSVRRSHKRIELLKKYGL